MTENNLVKKNLAMLEDFEKIGDKIGQSVATVIGKTLEKLENNFKNIFNTLNPPKQR